MDNYDLSNLPLLGHCADSGEHHTQSTEEQSRWATFSRRSPTFCTLDQAEPQQFLLTYEEQFSEQRVLADFDISLLSGTRDSGKFDEPEDPFATLAAFQPLTFDGNSQHPSNRELGLDLGFLGGFTAEDLTDVALAEPKGNDVLERAGQPEKSQGESDTHGIIIPESTAPGTVSDKRSGKRCALEPRNLLIRGIPKSSIEHSIELHFRKSLHKSERLIKKRQKLDSTEPKIVPLTQGVVARSQSVTKSERSASSEQATHQNPNESLKERIKRETEKWVLISMDEQGRKQYLCGYPDCSHATKMIGHLKTHIFTHIRISKHKCNYPECAKSCYFCDASALKRHVQSRHLHEKPYHCALCDKPFGRLHSYKRHMREIHKIAV